jgi:hypothetical protein
MIFTYKSSTDQPLNASCPEEYGEFTTSLSMHLFDFKIFKTHLYREITADAYIDLMPAGLIEG